MKIQCPKCKEEFEGSLRAVTSDEERMVLELTKKEGCAFTAETIGGVITAQSKLLKAVAKEIGQKVEVYVSKTEIGEQKASIEFLIVGIQKK